jgi:Tfp pilus assembly protein PilE
MIKKQKKNANGITIIALIITVIILLILAGVAINFALGKMG